MPQPLLQAFIRVERRKISPIKISVNSIQDEGAGSHLVADLLLLWQGLLSSISFGE
ncbi:hypothetical protein IFM89_001525 [Coptis chinensis]|uniref:Uncharacterized protein n=1 Tax=Coptis chinensis TaxID=261450 RepID=A0A835HZP7_9MAGN|nr:hypothetical protein IFM89_001525 [Coptis chinensis]